MYLDIYIYTYIYIYMYTFMYIYKYIYTYISFHLSLALPLPFDPPLDPLRPWCGAPIGVRDLGPLLSAITMDLFGLTGLVADLVRGRDARPPGPLLHGHCFHRGSTEGLKDSRPNDRHLLLRPSAHPATPSRPKADSRAHQEIDGIYIYISIYLSIYLYMCVYLYAYIYLCIYIYIKRKVSRNKEYLKNRWFIEKISFKWIGVPLFQDTPPIYGQSPPRPQDYTLFAAFGSSQASIEWYLLHLGEVKPVWMLFAYIQYRNIWSI